MEVDANILALIATMGHIMTGIGTIVLVILIIKTLKHMRVASRFTEIQTNYKFRPWIGPSNIIKEIEGNEKNNRFEIALKNYGDLPAPSVIVKSIVSESKITKEQLTSNNTNVFNLGPMLPNMEKRYWLYVDRNLIKNALATKNVIHTAMYFQYENLGKINGYGMISELNPETRSFAHKEMWVDTPDLEN
jgi:hypothetical protein